MTWNWLIHLATCLCRSRKAITSFLYADYARNIMRNGSCLYLDICVRCIYDHRVTVARRPQNCLKWQYDGVSLALIEGKVLLNIDRSEVYTFYADWTEQDLIDWLDYFTDSWDLIRACRRILFPELQRKVLKSRADGNLSVDFIYTLGIWPCPWIRDLRLSSRSLMNSCDQRGHMGR
jgi:hypothetical protein